jgi:hypothetical protein
MFLEGVRHVVACASAGVASRSSLISRTASQPEENGLAARLSRGGIRPDRGEALRESHIVQP